MKRFLITISILLFAVNAFAAARSASFSSKAAQSEYNDFIEITADITCDSTNGSFAALGLYLNDADQANGRLADLSGYFLHSVSVYFGSTAPTDNSDMTLLEHTSTGKDILVGAGTNMVDAAANNYFTTLVGTIPHHAPIFGPLYLVITGNSVNSATSTIVFKFIRRN